MRLRLLSAGLLLATAAFPAGPTGSAPTFNRDVAPVLYNRCVECHRTGEVAGIAFTTYKEVRPWAKAIKERVLTAFHAALAGRSALRRVPQRSPPLR